MKYHKDSVLVIADTHCPYEHKNYLDFLLEIRDRVHCGTIVHIGDGIDNSSLSMNHDTDPNGRSPIDEINEARKHLEKYYKAFPRLFYCLGNHCRRADLKGKHAQLPAICFRPFRDIWGLPEGWKDAFSHEIDGVLYMHGTGLSGDLAHIKAATLNRQSTCIGHTHSAAAVNYLVSNKDRLLAMNVGCGIDKTALAFQYGRDFLKKPVISCGVITDRGRYGQVFPMEL